MQCEHVKEGNLQCQAQAVKDDQFCFAHSQLPVIVEKRAEAKVLGGMHGRKKMLQPSTEEVSVRSPQQALDLLEQTVNDIRQNRISTSQANSIGFLLGVWSKIFQQEKLEDRIIALERIIFIKKQR